MPTTHGGLNKRKSFEWRFDSEQEQVLIVNLHGRKLSYPILDIQNILKSLHARFGDRYFPLGNDVALLGEGSEREGLGTAILKCYPGDITKAQGASYLGVILESCGYLAWNGKHKGIMWKITDADFSSGKIKTQLQDRSVYMG